MRQRPYNHEEQVRQSDLLFVVMIQSFLDSEARKKTEILYSYFSFTSQNKEDEPAIRTPDLRF